MESDGPLRFHKISSQVPSHLILTSSNEFDLFSLTTKLRKVKGLNPFRMDILVRNAFVFTTVWSVRQTSYSNKTLYS
jgi:hypothetical protein